MLFYLALTVYIFSVVGALVVFITVKKPGRQLIVAAVAIHLFLFIVFLINRIIVSPYSDYYLSFTVFLSSGILLFALSLRISGSLLLRFYFGLFALTIPVFLISPSAVLRFSITGKLYSDSNEKIEIRENLILEPQTTFGILDKNNYLYKAVRIKGMFHQTLKRDIQTAGKIDSIKILNWEAENSVLLRAYFRKETYVSDEQDSIDIDVPLKITRKNQIERRL